MAKWGYILVHTAHCVQYFTIVIVAAATTTVLVLPYDVLFSQNAQCHRQRDRQTDVSIMPIANHTIANHAAV